MKDRSSRCDDGVAALATRDEVVRVVGADLSTYLGHRQSAKMGNDRSKSSQIEQNFTEQILSRVASRVGP